MSYQVGLQHVFRFNCTFAYIIVNRCVLSPQNSFIWVLRKYAQWISSYGNHCKIYILLVSYHDMLNRFLVYNINQAINIYQRPTRHKIYQYLLLLAFYLLISKTIYCLSTCIIYFSKLIYSNDLSQNRTKFTLCNIGVSFCYAMLYCHASNGMCCIWILFTKPQWYSKQ